VLGVKPSALHQRIGLVFGSANEVERIERYHHEPVDDVAPPPLSHPAACSETEAMSLKHPIIAITGSSGAGTTSVTRTFENIFRREGVKAAAIEGDSFHRYDRKEMRERQAAAEKAGNKHFSHFGAENNLFAELEDLFRSYGESGTGRRRKYLHDPLEAAPYKQDPARSPPGRTWRRTPICCSTRACTAR
jgi:phosphoribulokinase